MSTTIRLSRAGTKKRPYYRILVTNSRSPRDSKFIEKIGTYSPLLPQGDAKRVTINEERAKYWLSVGATMSSRVHGFFNAAGLVAHVADEKHCAARVVGENLVDDHVGAGAGFEQRERRQDRGREAQAFRDRLGRLAIAQQVGREDGRDAVLFEGACQGFGAGDAHVVERRVEPRVALGVTNDSRAVFPADAGPPYTGIRTGYFFAGSKFDGNWINPRSVVLPSAAL